MNNQKTQFTHPHDTPLSALLRFATELIAWVASPWVMSTISSWLVLPTLLVLIGLPALFSTPNDKKHVVIPTIGPIRVLIELLLYAVAFIAPWYVWSVSVCVVSNVVAVASLLVGLPRIRWLLKGATV